MKSAACVGTMPGQPGTAAALAVCGIAVALIAVAAFDAGIDMLRVAMLLVVAPLTEETLLRAGLHDALLRSGAAPGNAVLMSAGVFAATHALVRDDMSAFAVVLPALVIGALYQRKRRLRYCVLLHAVMNALWLAASLGHASIAR